MQSEEKVSVGINSTWNSFHRTLLIHDVNSAFTVYSTIQNSMLLFSMMYAFSLYNY